MPLKIQHTPPECSSINTDDVMISVHANQKKEDKLLFNSCDGLFHTQ